jgi:hypothetical protein
MDMTDEPEKYPDSDVSQVVEELFQEHYLRPLGDDVSYVRLESMLGAIFPSSRTDDCFYSLAEMHMKDSRCDSLVEKTATALNEDTVALMLLAVQKGNLELSVKIALRR